VKSIFLGYINVSDIIGRTSTTVT